MKDRERVVNCPVEGCTWTTDATTTYDFTKLVNEYRATATTPDWQRKTWDHLTNTHDQAHADKTAEIARALNRKYHR